MARQPTATLALALALAACGGGDSDTPGAGRRLGAAPAAVCPGVDAARLSALYVSAQGSDDGFCGAYGVGGPCKTIARALSVAHTLSYRALVLQHGLYQTTETIDLKDGVSLYGSCRFGGEPDKKYRTVIQAHPAPGSPAISAHAANVTVSGVVVIGQDQTASGASVAMTVANANVTLRRTVLVAGKGGVGGSVPPELSAAVSGSNDVCYTPGGAASDSLWGQVDLRTATWASGIGGAGAGGGVTGPGGVGGGQGGASIGLLLVNGATVTPVADEFNRIVAGVGGVGGAGQAGPSFGLGGGANSGGAGGNGGPSIGVASINAPSTANDGSYIYANAAGGFGAGGAAGSEPECTAAPGAHGVPGGSATVYQFPIPTTLNPGESLAGGQSLYSPNLQFQLTMQLDSNLVLYNATRGVLYASNTKDQGIYQAIMQGDGNFCMYEHAGKFLPVCSGTAGRPGAHLTVQDSGHAQVIDASGAVAWSVP